MPSLPDPDGLIEGAGKNLRHIKVRTVEAAGQPGLRYLLEAARKLDGWPRTHTDVPPRAGFRLALKVW